MVNIVICSAIEASAVPFKPNSFVSANTKKRVTVLAVCAKLAGKQPHMFVDVSGPKII